MVTTWRGLELAKHSQLDGFFRFPLLLLLGTMYWVLDFGVDVQSNHIHLDVLLPWSFLRYIVGKNKLHLLPPLPTIKVSHVQ